MTRKNTSAYPRRNSLLSGFELLEQRWTPAQFGVPWVDPAHLTMSFAPDGTIAANQPSQLFAALDAQMPRQVWQSAIVRASQAWAEEANINIGLNRDLGQDFGAAGPSQGDSRFGDIRIGGFPMQPSSLAVSSPPATATAGSFAGDIFFNTDHAFTPESLYSVALHELGHTLGLDHSQDPTSVMFSHLNNNQSLSGSDIASIRDLYGQRALDSTEPTNNSFSGATRIRYSQVSGGYDGSTPVIQYGDLGTTTDVDHFYIKPLLGYSGPMTVRLQTNGISFVTPKITVFDRVGRVLATRTSSSENSDVLSVRLPNVVPDARYYIRVEAAPGAEYTVGRYGIAVIFDGLLRPLALPIDVVMRGRFEHLKPEKVDELFKTPATFVSEDDLHTNDSFATAVNLRVGPDNPSERDLVQMASLNDATDVDFYRVRTPPSSSSWVLTVTLRAAGVNAVLPEATVFDGNSQLLPMTIIANGNKTFTIQGTNVAANRSLYIRVASAGGDTGNYALDVHFGTVPAELNTFLTGAISTPAQAVTGKLYIAQTQLMNFVLSAGGTNGLLTMVIRDELGNVVQQLRAVAGSTVSSISQILAPGTYTFSFTSSARLPFTLRGSRITDPIGPVIDDGTLDPQFLNGTDGTFLFPNGTLTVIPYLWLFDFL